MIVDVVDLLNVLDARLALLLFIVFWSRDLLHSGSLLGCWACWACWAWGACWPPAPGRASWMMKAPANMLHDSTRNHRRLGLQLPGKEKKIERKGTVKQRQGKKQK
jgi:hypothetical protein